jgi:hypothetical protein
VTDTNSTLDPDSVCYIASTVDDDGKAACLLDWGPIQALLPIEVVLATAQDLMAAAARAETDVDLINAFRGDFNADDRMVAVVLTKVRGRRSSPNVKVALRIEAVAGRETGRPYVVTSRGSMRGQLSPDEARAMAVQWIDAAAAARIDVRLRYALGEWDHLDVVQVEELFDKLRKVQR